MGAEGGAGRIKVQSMEELSVLIGISRPTLSRYFQDPSRVRASTAERIASALEGVDYTPNFFATRLNRKTTGLIGVVVPYMSDLFFTSLLEVIEVAAGEAGSNIISLSSRGAPEVEARAAETLVSMGVDAAIVAPLGGRSQAPALERLAAAMPLTFVDSHLPGALPDVDFVGTDNMQSIGLITEYLCRAGEAPAFLGMPQINSNAAEREAAYIAEVTRQGFEPYVVPPRPGAEDWQFEAYGHAVLEEELGRGRMTRGAVLCANDRLAIGALRAANRHALTARERGEGGRLRIAGHDDHPLSRFMTPSLTTVSQDVEAIGREAVRRVAERAAGATASGTRRVFPATLRLRESA